MQLHERIKSARVKAGLTQADLAQRLGVDQSAIGHWERANGNGPKLDRAHQLAQVLGVDIGWLLWGTEESAIGPKLAVSEQQQTLELRTADTNQLMSLACVLMKKGFWFEAIPPSTTNAIWRLRVRRDHHDFIEGWIRGAAGASPAFHRPALL